MSIPVWGGVNIGTVGRKLKQIIDLYPGDKRGLYVTSAFRPNDRGSHHGGLSYGGSPTAAIDIGFGYGTSGYQARARAFAAWLYQFSGDTVELIVSKVGSGNANGGYYVKNGSRTGAYAHTGSNTSVRHEDHVHFATSSALADRILGRIRSSGSSSSSGSTPAPSRPTSSGVASGGGNPVAVQRWYTRPTLRQGQNQASTRDARAHLQFLLRNRLGYKIDSHQNAPFGPQTQRATVDFQRKYSHLENSGVVGPQTWAQLEVAAGHAITNKPTIRQGASGAWVGFAQHCLRKAGYRIDDIDGFPFGPQTHSAVVAFQRKYAWLQNDGVVGPNTWAALAAVERGQTPKDPRGGSTPTPPAPKPNPSTPEIVSRQQWGAAAPTYNFPRKTDWRGVTIHHTGGPLNQPIRNVQQAGFNSGVNDIHYHFLVSGGKVYVGGGWEHLRWHDAENSRMGFCFVGTYNDSLPSAEDLAAMDWLVAEYRRRYGNGKVVGHRDVSSTGCPGNRLYGIIDSRWN